MEERKNSVPRPLARLCRFDEIAGLPSHRPPSSCDLHPEPRGGEYEDTPPSEAKKMSRIFASWNQLDRWLRQIDRLRRLA